MDSRIVANISGSSVSAEKSESASLLLLLPAKARYCTCKIANVSSNSFFYSFYVTLTTEGNYQRGARHGRRAPHGQRDEEDDQVQRQERAEDDEETWAPITYDIRIV